MEDPVKVEKRRDRNRKNRAALHKERRVLIDEIKLAQGCIDCGYKKHPAALQFDHTDPSTKSFRISSSICRKWDNVLAEIAKCVVRCANCHSIKTNNSKEYGKGRPRAA